uniref:ZP domain-containing protein n=1 Tax=Syphacia muris TaxID=451379 RepID=A0A0N5ALT6_9BILA
MSLMLTKVAVIVLLLIRICPAEDSSSSFWLTAQLVGIEWRKGCLTTGGCGDPRFRLAETNWASNEQVSISWSILEDFNQDRPRIFVSHWKRGSPTDVTVACEVVGTDPTYGFPRICDTTGNVQAFMKDIAYEPISSKLRQSSGLDFEANKIVVELKGKCFNASLTVEKHEQQCPWCEEKRQQQQLFAYVGQPDSEGRNGTSVSSSEHRLSRDIQYVYMALAVLAGIALLSTAAFACLLMAFMRQRKCAVPLSSISNSKCPVETYYPSAIIGSGAADTVKISEESRYEMPWDQKYRPIPQWSTSRNTMSCSVTKPFTSGTLIYQTSRTPANDSVQYETPTLVMNDHHNDSGHDSV